MRAPSPVALGSGDVVRSSSVWSDGYRRLIRNRLAMAGGVVIILLCLIAIFADVLAPLPYTKTNFGRLNELPSRSYPLGTDALGRDLLSRMIYGARVSMLVGLGAASSWRPAPIGALSVGGRLDVPHPRHRRHTPSAPS
jgi:ABC-type dipeptide/oligopeptide/nickel transport system permease subunit